MNGTTASDQPLKPHWIGQRRPGVKCENSRLTTLSILERLERIFYLYSISTDTFPSSGEWRTIAVAIVLEGRTIASKEVTLKRILQERAESASRTAQPTQALIIGSGRIANIQPMGELIPPGSVPASNSQDTSGYRPAEVDPQTQESLTGVFGGDAGQVALVQTESEEVPQPSSSTLRPSLEPTPPSPTPLAIHRLPLHPSQSQPESFSEAYTSLPVLSLVVSPISASLPPLLSSQASSASGSLPTTVGSSTSSTDPVSTGVDNASDAPPLSQNPPIIVGILMVVLIVLAATVALVSWLTRSARRRRKNRLEALTFKTDNSEEGLTKMDSRPFEEKDMEEAMKYARPDREPAVPFYIEPHSTIFNHENYPEDEELHDSLRVHDGAYLPTLPPNIASYQPPRNVIRLRDQALPQQVDGSKAHPGPWKHDPNFLLHDDHSVLQANPQAIKETDRDITSSKSGQSFNLTLDLATQNAQPGFTRLPPTNGLSWANALRTNLVSALDVVKHATGDRLMQRETSSRAPANTEPASMEDRFTPLPLRPGREASSRRLQRRSTQEEYDLAFGRDRARAGSKITGSRSRERNEEGSEEEEGLGALQSRHSRSSAQRGAAIGGLGRFSFEQRMANSRSQILNTGLRNEHRNGMAVHSTALSRRRSGMASGSGSSSHSTPGSDLGSDATMRKRRPNAV